MAKQSTLRFIVKSTLFFMGYACNNASLIQGKPNIVWIMSEDIGTDLACYGTKGLQTPNLDNMAQDGLRLTRAYTTNPICSPSRSSMMTGMHQNSIDVHNHRSHRGDGYKLPQSMGTLTSLLRQEGYYTANGNGYNAKTDLNFNLRNSQKPLFDGNDWSKRQNGQPFYAQITLQKTHRNKSIDNWENIRANSPDPVDPSKIELPPYLPDKQEVRYDWALYLDQMEHVDGQVGAILKRLKDENILDNTMVIFIGDNGRCQVRGKGYLYEDGVNVPAIIRYPAKITAGTVSDELVPMIDIVAQILFEAGVSIPSYMQGRPFLENSAFNREFVFVARDRWDEIMEKSRSVIGKRFKLIRNDMALVPYDADQGYLNNSGVRPILPQLRTMFTNGELNPVQAQFFQPQKPEIQLFDLENDPWEINNLAGDTAHSDMVDSLMKKLAEWEREENDLGRIPEDPSVLDNTMKPRFDANVHMQKIIQTHKITLTIEGEGTAKASYCNLKDISSDMKARYGFEIYIDASPGSGLTVRDIYSDDVKGTFDMANNRYTFFMPLEDVEIKVVFGPSTRINTIHQQIEMKPSINLNGNVLQISNALTSNPVMLQIFDMSGKQVKIVEGIKDPVDLSSLSQRLYLFSLHTKKGNKLSYGKFILAQ